MPSLMSELSPWTVAVLIFLLRMCDVSIGTMRTISVVDGRTRLAVVLGFVEVLIWVTALSEVIARVHENYFLAFAFAGGFAAGNAVGIAAEKRLAFGSCVVRLISSGRGDAVADAVRPMGRMVTTFLSSGSDRKLVYVICSRRDLPGLLGAARQADPDLFYAVERFPQTSDVTPLFQPTGWRAVLKKK
jgi:uncharacterized protein YebE (UPF0316 family)